MSGYNCIGKSATLQAVPMSIAPNHLHLTVDEYGRRILPETLTDEDKIALIFDEILHIDRNGTRTLTLTEVFKHHRFTVDQYDRMIDLGILDEDDKVELIHGEIVEKMSPIGASHMACLRRLNLVLGRHLEGHALTGIQDSVKLRDSEPEPDYSVLKKVEHEYLHVKPVASDVLLLIEVADSTLRRDRTTKKKLYAENGIPEYWIYNIYDKQVEVFCQPQPDGTYADARILTADDRISLISLPEVEINLSEILDILD